MKLDDMLPAGGLEALASQLGIPREQAQRGAAALMPSILGKMGERAKDSNDANLEAKVQALGGPELADNVVSSQPTEIGRGNEILGTIFGSKDSSRKVAGHAAETSGLDPALLKKMLPILTMLLAGHLSERSAGQRGGLGGVLGTVLGGLGGGTAGGGSLGGMLGSVFGGKR